MVSGLLCSCQDDAESTSAKTYFVSATETSELSLQMLQAFTAGLGRTEIADLLKYGVKSYDLVYKTTFKGKAIEASGVLLIPTEITEAAPIISVQHGTTFVKEDAPSTGSYTGMELFASAGYIAFVPDYIGYGQSAAVFHPYYDREHSAASVIDMIKAGKEFLAKQKIAFNDKLFLAGYSEGGYVTLAAAKEIETNDEHNMKLTAVAAGAGGYDLLEMLKGVTTSTYYSYPSYLAFVLMSYNNTYNWNKPLTYFFKSQYAEALDKYMNGKYDGWYINNKLTTDVTDLLNSDFYVRLKEPNQELELKRALADNSVSGWKTAIPVRLYHGTKDEIIPYHNSEVTLEKFKNAGSSDVELTLIPNGTHGNSFMPMLEAIIPWFEQLR